MDVELAEELLMIDSSYWNMHRPYMIRKQHILVLCAMSHSKVKHHSNYIC